MMMLYGREAIFRKLRHGNDCSQLSSQTNVTRRSWSDRLFHGIIIFWTRLYLQMPILLKGNVNQIAKDFYLTHTHLHTQNSAVKRMRFLTSRCLCGSCWC